MSRIQAAGVAVAAAVIISLAALANYPLLSQVLPDGPHRIMFVIAITVLTIINFNKMMKQNHSVRMKVVAVNIAIALTLVITGIVGKTVSMATGTPVLGIVGMMIAAAVMGWLTTAAFRSWSHRFVV